MLDMIYIYIYIYLTITVLNNIFFLIKSPLRQHSVYSYIMLYNPPLKWSILANPPKIMAESFAGVGSPVHLVRQKLKDDIN